ncbi:BZ3500_MvSof-1268-A1-R1_Chr1-3g01858 [Microbotryum saponariae]|uniref:BZ3500_MvSof-1268-A1-R1_Chr1-3g01858 protein n=1 Tax=Microbotryum saponariae TaxID=289078 RepID=A0A2X0MFS9_9BASI|nr:BZ3500_MvSof-1268-A1-R1_Chr1-3g01858 [Microbotryum saponariae]SCZ94747.1 BZ3501_MvSof-1269-A2-R1_Chr1-3g01460 [Microbotryum saponariae]
MSLSKCIRSLPASTSSSLNLTRAVSTSTSSPSSSSSTDASSTPSSPAQPVLTSRQKQAQQSWSEMMTKVSERRARRYTGQYESPSPFPVPLPSIPDLPLLHTADAQMTHLGSTQDATSQYRPHHNLPRPPTSPSTTISHLIASGAHLGHSTALTHRAAIPSIYGTRTGISYIDLRQTLPALRRAAQVVRGVVERDGIVVFVGSLKGTEKTLWTNAQRLGPNGYAVTKWLPGTISNAREVFKHSEIPFTVPPTPSYGGGRDKREKAPTKPTPTSFKPDLMILLSPTLNEHALREATSNEIPTIGIMDTDLDPRLVTYSIPANDDSPRTIELIAGVLGMAGKDGLQRKVKRQAIEAMRLASRKQGMMEARKLGSHY